MGQHPGGAVEGAAEGAADPDLVLAHRLGVEQRVEGGHPKHVGRGQVQPGGDPGDGVEVVASC